MFFEICEKYRDAVLVLEVLGEGVELGAERGEVAGEGLENGDEKCDGRRRRFRQLDCGVDGSRGYDPAEVGLEEEEEGPDCRCVGWVCLDEEKNLGVARMRDGSLKEKDSTNLLKPVEKLVAKL